MSWRGIWTGWFLVAVVVAGVLLAPASPPASDPDAGVRLPAGITTPLAGSSLCVMGPGPVTRLNLSGEDGASPDTDPPAGAPDADPRDGDASAAPPEPEDDAEELDPAAPVVEPEGSRASGTVTVSRPGETGGPALVEAAGVAQGGLASTALPPVFPGSHVLHPLAGDAAASWVRWREQPVAVERSWVLAGDDVPSGAVAGGCARTAAGSHLVPGMSTAGGDEARLRFANPYRTAATVAVSFLTPSGSEAPLILRNVSVPPREVREIVVNEVLPERADLAVEVEVLTGRVAVEGLQLARSGIGGVDGAALLAASLQPAEDWTVPWVRDDDETTSWLWIANPGPQTAPVELTLHGPDGGQVPDGLAEVSVPPGEQRRIDLTGTFPAGVEVAGVTARSNGAPVVVAAGSWVDPGEAEASGIAVQLGVVADASWVVSGHDAELRTDALHLVVPGSVDAEVHVRVFNGSRLSAPADLQGLRIPAGGSRTVELTPFLDGAPNWTVFVEARAGDLVVGRVGARVDGPRHFLAVPGVPARSWSADPSGLALRAVEGLTRVLGTGGDPGAPAPSPGDEPAVPVD